MRRGREEAEAQLRLQEHELVPLNEILERADARQHGARSCALSGALDALGFTCLHARCRL
jgi:hypothetical protein